MTTKFKETLDIMRIAVFVCIACAFIIGMIIGVQIGRRRAVGDLPKEYKAMAAEQQLIMTMIPSISENLKRLEEIIKELEHEYEMIMIWNEVNRPEGGKR